MQALFRILDCWLKGLILIHLIYVKVKFLVIEESHLRKWYIVEDHLTKVVHRCTHAEILQSDLLCWVFLHRVVKNECFFLELQTSFDWCHHQITQCIYREKLITRVLTFVCEGNYRQFYLVGTFHGGRAQNDSYL